MKTGIRFLINEVFIFCYIDSVSKHANLIYECITYYIYTYQLRYPKQDILGTI